MQAASPSPAVPLRVATIDAAQAIGAVFDAAVRAGWTYLGELAEKPMFAPADWERLVADHAPPNVLLVATDGAGQVVGYTAAHSRGRRAVPALRAPRSCGTRHRAHTARRGA